MSKCYKCGAEYLCDTCTKTRPTCDGKRVFCSESNGCTGYAVTSCEDHENRGIELKVGDVIYSRPRFQLMVRKTITRVTPTQALAEDKRCPVRLKRFQSDRYSMREIGDNSQWDRAIWAIETPELENEFTCVHNADFLKSIDYDTLELKIVVEMADKLREHLKLKEENK